MADDIKPPEGATGVEIIPAGSGPLTVRYAPRTLRMLTVSEAELDAVAAPEGSIHFGLLGMSFGSLTGFGTTLATVDITNPKIFSAFVALTAVSVISSINFGVRAFMDHRASRRRLRELKRDA